MSNQISLEELMKLREETAIPENSDLVNDLIIELQEKADQLHGEEFDPVTMCRILRAISSIAITLCSLIGAES